MAEEPVHTLKERTTADSKAEGRLRKDIAGSKKRKKDKLKKLVEKYKKRA